MNVIYIFSDNYCIVKHINDEFYVNKNSIIKIDNVNKNDSLEIVCPTKNNGITINLSNLNTCNYYKVYKLYDCLFIYIVGSDFENLTQKLELDAEVFVYDNCVRLIFESYCYTHPFNGNFETNIAKKEEILYIYNKSNLLLFNTNNKTFLLLNVEIFEKIGKNIEILCKIPKVFNYFILFSFSNQNLNQIKKLQKGEIQLHEKALPYVLFYLCKFKFEECKKIISDNINYLDLFNYFEDYENILEVEKRFFLIGHNKITPINFNIRDGKIIDVD